jgi:hypothetical protein
MRFSLFILTLIFVCANASEEKDSGSPLRSLSFSFSNDVVDSKTITPTMPLNEKPEADNLDFKFVKPEAHRLQTVFFGGSPRIECVKIQDPAENESRTRNKSQSSKPSNNFPTDRKREMVSKINQSIKKEPEFLKWIQNTLKANTQIKNLDIKNPIPQYVQLMDEQSEYLAAIFKMKDKTEQQKQFEKFVDNLFLQRMFDPFLASISINEIILQKQLIKSSTGKTKDAIFRMKEKSF